MRGVINSLINFELLIRPWIEQYACYDIIFYNLISFDVVRCFEWVANAQLQNEVRQVI